jgi:putative addiction module component (TIGR02574 family)
MNSYLPPDELGKLSVAERLRLMEDIWASLCAEPGQLEVPAWHRDELDRRIEREVAGALEARSWPEVRAEVLAALRKT